MRQHLTGSAPALRRIYRSPRPAPVPSGGRKHGGDTAAERLSEPCGLGDGYCSQSRSARAPGGGNAAARVNGAKTVTTAAAAFRPGDASTLRPAWGSVSTGGTVLLRPSDRRPVASDRADTRANRPGAGQSRAPFPHVEAGTASAVNGAATANGKRAVAMTEEERPCAVRRQALQAPGANRAMTRPSRDRQQGAVLPALLAGLRRLRTPARPRDRPAPNAASSASRLATTSRSACALGCACG